jgi:hypothetical protein
MQFTLHVLEQCYTFSLSTELLHPIHRSAHCSLYCPPTTIPPIAVVLVKKMKNYFLISQTRSTTHNKYNTVLGFSNPLLLTMALGPYFDPLGETEPENTIYTLTVCCPPRPPPKWLPSFVTRTPVTHPNTGAAYTIKPDDTNPNLDCFEEKHLEDVRTKVIKLKRSLFPLSMRCVHVRDKTTCDERCYFLEKGGVVSRWWCSEEKGCEGHVYCGRVKKDGEGNSCFGKKGERMVCIGY